jgi:amidophosphoribosyltransferase
MCGIIGILSPEGKEARQQLYDGLLVLQHRGQDAAGIVTCDKERFYQRKSNGMVNDVFRQRHMNLLGGKMGIGHVRYPTAGSSSSAEAQPFYTNSPYGMALAHNGNLTNAAELLNEVIHHDRRHVNTNSDSEILLNILASELGRTHTTQIEGELYLDCDDLFDAVEKVNDRVNGSYAAVCILSGYGILAFRDPYGIRPLIHGVKEDDDGNKTHVFASESVALITLGCKIVGDVKPGEAVFVDENGIVRRRICHSSPKLNPCIFEHVYFARPDSVIDGISVYEARIKMGEKLANRILKEKQNHQIDVVMPIPDSGRISAMEVARTLGVEYREGFVKNRYVGRTFIMPGQAIRKDSVRKKLNPIPHEFEGKRVLLVDDSIVRGNTSRKIVQLARDVGAKEVFFASAAPPVLFPNVYGIDMPAKEEYIAHNRTIDEITQAIGSDWVIYQSLEDLEKAVIEACNGEVIEFDSSCFTGNYVCGTITPDYLESVGNARKDGAKVKNSPSDQTLEIHNEE